MADWHFDWLDVPAIHHGADQILEYPMVDQDPLPRWSFGRLTLLGDAAHPMYPRGANGGAQAILDCRALSDALAAIADPVEALKVYEAKRLPATSEVVLANRKAPPDAILQEVYRRTGDKPFKPHRRRHQPRRADRAVGELQAGGGLRQRAAEGAHDPEKWEPVFGLDHAQTKKRKRPRMKGARTSGGTDLSWSST